MTTKKAVVAEDSLESALRCLRSPARSGRIVLLLFLHRVACTESKNKIMFENLTVQLQLRSDGGQHWITSTVD